MTCGSCGHSFSLFIFLRAHWFTAGCQKARTVWARVLEARRRGTSGRRILHQAYPHLYKSEPMPEEVKARFRAKDAGAALAVLFVHSVFFGLTAAQAVLA